MQTTSNTEAGIARRWGLARARRTETGIWIAGNEIPAGARLLAVGGRQLGGVGGAAAAETDKIFEEKDTSLTFGVAWTPLQFAEAAKEAAHPLPQATRFGSEPQTALRNSWS